MRVANAYHTSAVSHEQCALRPLATLIGPGATAAELHSSVAGCRLASCGAAHAADLWRRPVLFWPVMASLARWARLGRRAHFLDLSPHPSLSAVLQASLSLASAPVVPLLYRGEPEEGSLRAARAAVACGLLLRPAPKEASAVEVLDRDGYVTKAGAGEFFPFPHAIESKLKCSLRKRVELQHRCARSVSRSTINRSFSI